MVDGSSEGGDDRTANRRDLLRALTGVGAAGLAGCSLASNGDGTATDDSDSEPAPTAGPDGDTPVDGTPTEGSRETPTEFEPTVPEEPALLVLSVTAGYRHDSIEAGNEAIRELTEAIATDLGVESVTVDVVDDPDGDASDFPSDAEELADYDAVVWNNTTGSVLDADQRAAFREYINDGGGYVGVHAAADTHYDWEWYGDLVGAYFSDHPQVQSARVTVTDRAHPSTAHLPAVWAVEDEWYDYRSNPRGDVHVLATLEEDSYEGATMDEGRVDHPIAWCQPFEGGRSWYTGRGHTSAAFEADAFREHLRKGIMWAAGYVDGDASGTIWDSYSLTPLETVLEQPIAIDVADDGRVFLIERGGTLSIVDDGETSTALELSVYTGQDDEPPQEDGLLGLALDPDFAENGWLYLYYSPPGDEIDDPHNRLSRFTVEGGSVDPASEAELLRVGTQRETCCHTGGELHFDPDGNLLLTTGDDTNPFESQGYAPIDERPDRTAYDAQRTAANTADLRGKVLRITPREDGSYTVPEDNLFTEAGGYGEEIEAGLVREEIYVMGVRNPYTAAIDEETGWFYVADYGPDAARWDRERGPPGIVEFDQIREAGNQGWPYSVGPNAPYRDYDFETEESGEWFDPENPVNASPNNTGLEQLPPARESTLFYPKDWENYLNPPADAPVTVPDRVPYPDLPAGGGPTAGPVFHHRDSHGENGLPASFEGKHFVAEWGLGWLQYVSFDESGNVTEIDPFLPDETFEGPIDVAVGPEGELYLLEFGGWAGVDGSRLSRIDHTW
jgi:glucose/arabinose dehydrogenase/type 1 glutamine amidotransferase